MSFRRALLAIAGALLLLGSALPAAEAQGRRDLILLGEKEVGFRVDRDVINIGQSEDWYRTRTFRALHFVARGNDVHMMNIRLVYFNGFAEELRVDQLIRQGQDLPVDLRGERSYLRRIEMVYRSRPDYRGAAVIQVYGAPGRHGPPPIPPGPPVAAGGWTELGCKSVSLVGKDRDVLEVGRREGRFKAVRLHVRGNDIELLDLNVIYVNGDPDHIPVKRKIRAGERTQALDLKGWQRAIDRVEMIYKTALNPGNIILKGGLRQASVCVEGLQ